jgi:hypothetical protein
VYPQIKSYTGLECVKGKKLEAFLSSKTQSCILLQ